MLIVPQVHSFDYLIQSMVNKIVQTLSLASNDQVAVIINNLGTVSQLEMGVICNKVYNKLSKFDLSTICRKNLSYCHSSLEHCSIFNLPADANIQVYRMYYGSLMTSLDMAGFQISVLNVTRHLYWVAHLDSHTDAPGWPSTCVSVPLPETAEIVTIDDEETSLLNVCDHLI